MFESGRGVHHEFPTDNVYTREKRKKNHAHTLYRHECEPVIQMLNTAEMYTQ
jgi:hypothetical protein